MQLLDFMIREELTDKELINKILEGNTRIFEIIISKTQHLVLSIVYKMIKNPEDRKDITQEVYLKAYNKLASFKFNAKLSTWIGTITYNTCLNYLARKKIPILNVTDEEEKESWESIERQFLMDTKSQPEINLFKKERSKIISSEIDKLSPLYKTILSLYHKQELSYKEITTITGLPEGTVKSYLYRARKQLRMNLLVNYKKEDL